VQNLPKTRSAEFHQSKVAFFMRQPRPFFRKQTKSYYVQIGKKQINLGKDEKEAYRRYHELMASPPEPESTSTQTVLGPDGPACLVLDAFLEYSSKHGTAGFETGSFSAEEACSGFGRNGGRIAVDRSAQCV